MANIIFGFAPSWLEGQQNAGLSIWIASGQINGINVNGQTVSVPANATTLIWVTATGVIQSGPQIPNGAYGIASVVSGTIITGGNTNAGLRGPLGKWSGLSTDNGILSITDTRS